MKPGVKSILLGIFLLITGMIILPVAIMLSFVFVDTHEQYFEVPGSSKLTIDEPGRYYLWNNYKLFHEGKTYNQSVDLPNGLTIEAKGTAGDYEIHSSTNISFNSGSDSSQSIAYIDIEESDTVEITVKNLDETRMFSISKPGILDRFGKFLAFIILIVLIDLFGFILILIGAIRVSKNKA